MNYIFGAGPHYLPPSAAAIARQYDATLLHYTLPGCGCGQGCRTECPALRRHWFEAPDQGERSNTQTAAQVLAALRAAGMLAEEDAVTGPLGEQDPDDPIITPEAWATILLETFPDLPMPHARPRGPRSRKPVQQALPFALPLCSHMGLQEQEDDSLADEDRDFLPGNPTEYGDST